MVVVLFNTNSYPCETRQNTTENFETCFPNYHFKQSLSKATSFTVFFDTCHQLVKTHYKGIYYIIQYNEQAENVRESRTVCASTGSDGKRESCGVRDTRYLKNTSRTIISLNPQLSVTWSLTVYIYCDICVQRITQF